MTWSIVAADPATGRTGIIVATRFFAVGSRVPSIRTAVGAVASQAFMNPYYGPRILDLLAAGVAPEKAIATVTEADDGRDHRQLHVMDRQGRFAAYTGRQCIDFCGHAVHSTFSVAGNMLAGPAVIEETVRAYLDRASLPFARRLIAAMKAGEAAGGDKRGKQSAALLVHDDQDYSLYDLRVDDHPDPLAEIERLQLVARQRYIHFRRRMPSKASPAGHTERADLEDFIARSIAEGYE